MELELFSAEPLDFSLELLDFSPELPDFSLELPESEPFSELFSEEPDELVLELFAASRLSVR